MNRVLKSQDSRTAVPDPGLQTVSSMAAAGEHVETTDQCLGARVWVGLTGKSSPLDLVHCS